MLVTKLVMEHAVHEQDEKEIAALKEMNGALFAEVVKTKMEEDAIVRRASQVSQCLCLRVTRGVCRICRV